MPLEKKSLPRKWAEAAGLFVLMLFFMAIGFAMRDEPPMSRFNRAKAEAAAKLECQPPVYLGPNGPVKWEQE